MASQITDDLIQSSRLVKRRYVEIPKDQKVLFESDAWCDTLNRGPHPMVNIPPDVLQNLKDVRMGKNGKPSQPSPSGSRPSTANSASRPPKTIPQKESSAPLQDDAEESDAPLCSWDPSQQPDRSREEEESEEFVQAVVRNSSPARRLRSSPPKSQLKRKLPPSFVNNGPQSTAASEDLDFEPLGFVTQELEPPVNRVASRLIASGSRKLEATPPSAQMPLATLHGTAKPPPTKKRRMGEIIRSGEEQDLSQVAPVSEKSSSGLFVDSNSNSLHISASTPSLGTQRDRLNQSSEQRSKSDPAMYQQDSSLSLTYEGRQRAAAVEDLVFTGTSLPGPSHAPPPAQKTAPVKGSSNSQTPFPQALVQSPSASPPVTFDTFKTAYPDYPGTLRLFVAALLIVEQLKRQREAHESLYDDFIRAYTSEYFVYISECSRKGVGNILPGIQWYNEHVERVLYKKEVVRKNNLGDFLAAYPDEVQSVKQSVGDSQVDAETSDEEMEEATDEDDEMAQGGSNHEEHAEQVPEGIELDLDDNASQGSPEYQIRSPTVLTQSSRRASLDRRSESPTPGSPEYQIQSPAMPTQSGRRASPDRPSKSPDLIAKGTRSFGKGEPTSVRISPKKPLPAVTGDNIDSHSSAAEAEEAQNTEASLGEEDNGRDSPDIHIESPSEPNPAVTLNGWDAANTPGRAASSQARKSPTSAKSFASQENSHEYLRAIASSSLQLSPLRNEKQAQRGPSISPPPRPARPSTSNVPRKATPTNVEAKGDQRLDSSPLKMPRKSTVGDQEDHEADDLNTLPKPLPESSARPSLSNVPRKAVLEDEEDDEDDSFAPPPIPLPRRSARHSPNKQPTSSYKEPVVLSSDDDDDDDDDEEDDPAQLPMPPLREPPRPASSKKAPPISRNKKKVDQYELAGSSPPKAFASSPPKAFAPSPKPMTKRSSTAGNDIDNAFATQVSLLATQEAPARDHHSLPGSSPSQPVAPSPKLMTRQLSTGGTNGGNAFATPTQEVPVRKAKPSFFEAAPPKAMARTSPASAKPAASPSTTAEAARPAFTSTMPVVAPSGPERRPLPQPKQPAALISKTSAPSMDTGKSHSRASSMSSAKLPGKKQAERSRRLQEFARKRKEAMGLTPSSTAASKQ